MDGTRAVNSVGVGKQTSTLGDFGGKGIEVEPMKADGSELDKPVVGDKYKGVLIVQ